MAREIPLTKGYVAIVDDEDYERVSRRSWCARPGGNGNVYAARGIVRRKEGLRYIQLMHREVLGLDPAYSTDPPVVVDHINGDTLDNRKANLRICTQAQNSRNRRKIKAGRSIYKGVMPRPEHGSFKARIRIDGKLINLGSYATEKDAALAYDVAAREHFGEYARLNFPDESIVPSPVHRTSEAGFIGVVERYGRFRSRIRIGDKLVCLGNYSSAEEAARAYDARARELGRARLNFPTDDASS